MFNNKFSFNVLCLSDEQIHNMIRDEQRHIYCGLLEQVDEFEMEDTDAWDMQRDNLKGLAWSYAMEDDRWAIWLKMDDTLQWAKQAILQSERMLREYGLGWVYVLTEEDFVWRCSPEELDSELNNVSEHGLECHVMEDQVLGAARFANQRVSTENIPF